MSFWGGALFNVHVEVCERSLRKEYVVSLGGSFPNGAAICAEWGDLSQPQMLPLS